MGLCHNFQVLLLMQASFSLTSLPVSSLSHLFPASPTPAGDNLACVLQYFIHAYVTICVYKLCYIDTHKGFSLFLKCRAIALLLHTLLFFFLTCILAVEIPPGELSGQLSFILIGCIKLHCMGVSQLTH